MKKLLLFLFIPLMTALGVWGQTTMPVPFDLSTGSYTFTSWLATAPAGTFPPNMRFHRTGTQDPGLLVEMTTDYTLAYNLTSGTRINGLGAEGISFFNTGTAGNLGAAVVALNTTGRFNIQVSWLGGTVAAASIDRVYAIRLQYRIGTEGSWTDVPGPVEYVSSTADHFTNFGATPLPSSCENQPLVFLRWKYYSVSGASGTRPRLRLDDITVSSVSPAITVSPATLSGFYYVEGQGPSATQSFTVSGANLRNDIVLTAPANYQISLTDAPDFVPASPVTLTQTGGTVNNTSVFVRLATGLPAGAYNNEVINITSDFATPKTVTLHGNVITLDPEPTHHATVFTATASSAGQITVTWTDASGGQLPSAYLVKAAVSPAYATAPIDGTPEADALLVKNIAQGVQQAVFTGLTPATTYNFSIWPYTNIGRYINYKTDGIVPTASATTTIITYTWVGGASGVWTAATNWTPLRTTPHATDVLLFSHGDVATVTYVPPQTIGRLVVINDTPVTLQAAAAATLTIAGAAGVEDLEVHAGSALYLAGGHAINITLGAGATGSVSGTMSVAGAAHRLTPPGTARSIIFHTRAVFETKTGFSGNPFGAVTGTGGAVIFSSGATYNHNAGGNPFGFGQPASVVVFETGSLYRHLTTTVPTGLTGGRIFADFELNVAGSISITGGAAVRIDNLIITQGTLNFNMTGNPALRHSIRGNITVRPLAILNFNPASAGTVWLNGTVQQVISGGGTITEGPVLATSTISIDNPAGVLLDNAATLRNVTILNRSLTINPGRTLSIFGTLTNGAGNTGLVLLSGASLIHHTPGVPATMQRHFPGGRNWRLVSSPVADQAIIGAWTPDSPNHGYDFYAWDEPAETWRNQKVEANKITHFVPGRGYLVSFEGTDLTQSFAGPLNNGTVTVTLTRGHTGPHGGANLLGNPYPSAIDWSLADRTPFADNFAYIYNPLLGEGGGYETVNGAIAGALIAPNQGFFVLANAAGNFTFTNTMRRHGGAFKNAPVVENLVLRLSQGDFFDETTLHLVPESQWERDRNDAIKMFSFNEAMPQLFSLSANQVQLAINSVPQVRTDSEFTLGLRAPSTGQYTLSLQSTQGAFASVGDVFIRDLTTGVVQNLSSNPAFSFHATQGDHHGRFVVTYTQPTSVGNVPDASTAIYVYNQVLYLNFAQEENNERQMQVIDLSGRVVLAKRLPGGVTSMQVPLGLQQGVYIVRITGENTSVARRVMVR